MFLQHTLNNVFSLLIILLVIFFGLYITRTISHSELDDMHPAIPCQKELLEESDVFWIIPLYENISIAENMTWCREILSLNKTLGLHGINHKYNEFLEGRSEEYLERGIEEFEKCFGYRPEKFKAPRLEISKENKELVSEYGMKLKGRLNQITHKVYHCNDHGDYPNAFIRWF
ncbi:MAG: hypothetical protein AABW65_01200 [Nanoarchaeota archaeon]